MWFYVTFRSTKGGGGFMLHLGALREGAVLCYLREGVVLLHLGAVREGVVLCYI